MQTSFWLKPSGASPSRALQRLQWTRVHRQTTWPPTFSEGMGGGGAAANPPRPDAANAGCAAAMPVVTEAQLQERARVAAQDATARLVVAGAEFAAATVFADAAAAELLLLQEARAAPAPAPAMPPQSLGQQPQVQLQQVVPEIAQPSAPGAPPGLRATELVAPPDYAADYTANAQVASLLSAGDGAAVALETGASREELDRWLIAWADAIQFPGPPAGTAPVPPPVAAAAATGPFF